MAKSITGPARLLHEDRLQRAMALKIACVGSAAIAATLGCTRQHVHRLLREGLARRQAAGAADAEVLRAMECERLDTMHLKVWAIMSAADAPPHVVLHAIGCLVRLSERRARLLRLDTPAPAKHDAAGNRRETKPRVLVGEFPNVRGATAAEQAEVRAIVERIKARG